MADTARTRPGTDGGITSPDYWEARWKQARADAAADTALAIGGPEGHTASEWHSGRFRFHTRGVDFVASGSSISRCAAYCSRDVTFNPASGVITQVPLDRDQFDPDGWHNEAISSPYVDLPTEGDYQVLASFRPSSASTVPRIPVQLWLYGGAAGNTILDRDEDTYHQDDEHTGGWGNDSWRTLRIVYADHFAAGTRLNPRFRHFTGDASTVSFAYENELGPRLLVTKVG
jgi:hypothetical protein